MCHAFDKVNHSSLFMKLMTRRIPLELLELLENWLSEFYAYVKWSESWSHIRISSGVRQSSVLSPLLFSVYIDDIGQLQNNLTGRGSTFVLHGRLELYRIIASLWAGTWLNRYSAPYETVQVIVFVEHSFEDIFLAISKTIEALRHQTVDVRRFVP